MSVQVFETSPGPEHHGPASRPVIRSTSARTCRGHIPRAVSLLGPEAESDYLASMRSSVRFGSRTTIAVPDSIRYSSPGLKTRPSGATSRVPLSGGRMPPPRRGTPLTKSIPRETPRSMKCARLTQISVP